MTFGRDVLFGRKSLYEEQTQRISKSLAVFSVNTALNKLSTGSLSHGKNNHLFHAFCENECSHLDSTVELLSILFFVTSLSSLKQVQNTPL